MDYIYLIAACALFSFQFIFVKSFQVRQGAGIASAVKMSAISGIWTLLILWCLYGFGIRYTAYSVVCAFFFALMNMTMNVIVLISMKAGNISRITLSVMTGGLVLPVVYGLAALDEVLSVPSVIGIILIIASFFFRLSPSENAKGQSSGKLPIPGLLLSAMYLTAFMLNGLISVLTKAHSVNPAAVAGNDFIILASLFNILLGGIILTVLRFVPRGEGEKPRIDRKGLILSVSAAGMYAVCNSLGNVSSMYSARTVNSSFQFPIISAAVLLLTALLSFLVYREKPGVKEGVGLAVTVAGILLMLV